MAKLEDTSSDRGFTDITPKRLLDSQSLEERQIQRSTLANKKRNANRNRAILASNAGQHSGQRERIKNIENTRAASDKSIAQAVARAEHTSKALTTLSQIIKLAPEMAEQEGSNLNRAHAHLTSRNAQWEWLGGSEANVSTESIEGRGKGAILPPPHPKSLGEKMKHSPKAKRDAWRAGKIAGVAPTIDLSPRAKGWDKVKAWEIGDLPKTD